MTRYILCFAVFFEELHCLSVARTIKINDALVLLYDAEGFCLWARGAVLDSQVHLTIDCRRGFSVAMGYVVAVRIDQVPGRGPLVRVFSSATQPSTYGHMRRP